MKQEENKLLPVPLKYTYPIISSIKIPWKKKHNILYYVPELNRLIYKDSIPGIFKKLGINRYIWELRWIYKVDGKTLADKNLLVDEIIRIFFNDRQENTKKYIKAQLLKDINYKPDFYCLKSDIIDLIFKNNINSVYMSWYDFSKVPNFIKTRDSKFKLIVKERYFINGKRIEDWETNFHYIQDGHDAQKVGKHKESISLMLRNAQLFKSTAKRKFGKFVDYSEAEYKGSEYPIKLKCKVCGCVYYQTPGTHIISSINTHGCPECNKRHLRGLYSDTFEDFVSKSRKIHGDRYIYFKEYYIDHITPTKIYDNNRKEFFYQKPSKHVSGHGNNECQNSMGEGLIKTWLVDNNINFNYGVVINGLIQGRNIDRVIIDFTVSLNNSTIWIEYQGIQHYKETNFFYYNNGSTFEKQLQRDKNVREYCKNNSIQLIEVPYTYKDYKCVKDLLDRVILNGEDINSIIDYNSLYNS